MPSSKLVTATLRLTASDAPAFLDLRRAMLLDSPWAFGSSPEDDRIQDAESARNSLSQQENAIFAVRDPADPARLLAAAGVMREPKLKRRHVATIWGVFTRPEARGRGLGRAVTTAAMTEALTWRDPEIAVLTLSVSVPDQGPSPARALYESLGFSVWGVEPDALRTADGRAFAEAHMQLKRAGLEQNPA